MSNGAHLHARPAQLPDVPVVAAVPLSPVPTQMMVRQLDTPTGRMVQVITATPTGTHSVFLPPDTAREVARMLDACASPVSLG